MANAGATRRARRNGLVTGLLWTQGVTTSSTGLWPLVQYAVVPGRHRDKTDHLQSPHPTLIDHWLVNAVGVLVMAVGLTLLAGRLAACLDAGAGRAGDRSASAEPRSNVIYVARR